MFLTLSLRSENISVRGSSKCIQAPHLILEAGLSTQALINDNSPTLINQAWQKRSTSIWNKAKAKDSVANATTCSGTKIPYSQADIRKKLARKILCAYTHATRQKVLPQDKSGSRAKSRHHLCSIKSTSPKISARPILLPTGML
jgi:hypothetical protein